MFYFFTRKTKEEILLADQLRSLSSIKVSCKGGISISKEEIYRQQKENTASVLRSFPTADA